MTMIKVTESAYVQDEQRLKFYEENEFIPLFEMADLIGEGIQNIEDWTTVYINQQTAKIEDLQTEEEKQQWYTETSRGLTQINQAVYSVMVTLSVNTKK